MYLDRYLALIRGKSWARGRKEGASRVVAFLQQSEDFLSKSKSFYRPLDTDKREIRLLCILPGSKDEPVQIELSTCSLDDEPQYVAISYTWESLEKPLAVYVNGLSYNVTRNQHAALRQLRSSMAAQTLWMDVICINQASRDDKTQQVAFMGEIYGCATQTLIWLGDPDMFLAGFWTRDRLQRLEDDVVKPFESRGTFKNFENAPTPPSVLQDDPNPVEEVRNAVAALQLLNSHDLTLISNVRIPFWTRHSDGKIALSRTWLRAMTVALELLGRPWWSRVWTLQEAVLSSQPATVLMGPVEIPLAFFSESTHNILGPAMAADVRPTQGDGFPMDELRTSLLGLLVWPEAFGRAHEIPLQRMEIGKEYKATKGLSFLYILAEATGMTTNHATMAQDIIFGLLGMCNDGATCGVRVDYSAPVSKVFADTTWSVIEQNCSLQCLSDGNGLNGSLGLSSWVRDWTISERDLNEKRGLWNEREDSNEFTHKSLARYMNYNEEIRTLCLPVKIIETIQGHSRWSGPDHEHLSTPAQILKTVRRWFNYLDAQKPSLEAADIWRIIFKNSPYLRSLDVKNGDYETFGRWIRTLTQNVSRSGPIQVDQLRYQFRQGVSFSRPFVTQSGKLGAGFNALNKGDVICYIPTCEKPFILRSLKLKETRGKSQEGNAVSKYRLVGACYLDQAMPDPRKNPPDDPEMETIELH